LTDLGRPRAIKLAIFVDRGWRELPIHADFVGMTVETAGENIVKVKLREVDGDERVDLV
jgi:pyrimidine operon attenuation protein/uracil phosphoribosyltransferase